jgi:hypothetical protein
VHTKYCNIAISPHPSKSRAPMLFLSERQRRTIEQTADREGADNRAPRTVSCRLAAGHRRELRLNLGPLPRAPRASRPMAIHHVF